MLKINNLTKRFGGLAAVIDVSVEFAATGLACFGRRFARQTAAAPGQEGADHALGHEDHQQYQDLPAAAPAPDDLRVIFLALLS